ncbi:hypothetical protein BEP19_16800 [Ammoniphilus oxalaticus]|uniref:Thioredoxin n=1 Tax=Ammoniphilus oxalaticus TaxID=66863 RepID=A0A419SQ23_9BACL|nr:hypothetical protein [Ammoniphilus oxalaticus]RKD26496.1 hypothetical protein BEP19_16800 [Ammoniphilus oxalaticus]
MRKSIGWLMPLAFLLLMACGSGGNGGSYFTQTSFDEINRYFEGDQDGFVFITVDNDEPFVKTVEQVANQEKVTVWMYNPYRADGANRNEDGRPMYPDSSDIRGNSVFYMENNRVVGELPADGYAGSRLVEELTSFFNLYR